MCRLRRTPCRSLGGGSRRISVKLGGHWGAYRSPGEQRAFLLLPWSPSLLRTLYPVSNSETTLATGGTRDSGGSEIAFPGSCRISACQASIWVGRTSPLTGAVFCLCYLAARIQTGLFRCTGCCGVFASCGACALG